VDDNKKLYEFYLKKNQLEYKNWMYRDINENKRTQWFRCSEPIKWNHSEYVRLSLKNDMHYEPTIINKIALDTQIGGDHYRIGSIQPVQFIEANDLKFLEGNVVKRVTRHELPGGKGRQDIEKAIHELQLLLELRYADD
jgi:hypothetical protein